MDDYLFPGALAHVAGEIPDSGKEESQIMQLRRWLKNEKVGVDLFYLPPFC